MIQNALKAISDRMKADFIASSSNPHDLSKGESRERFVIYTYLKRYLPPRYGITSGIVIDPSGSCSRQQDIIIYDRFNTMPLFADSDNLESQTIVPIENVFAIIEVKTTLDSSGISDAFEKYESVCNLIPKPQQLNPVVSIQTNFPAPAGFCFSFRSDSDIEIIAKRVHETRMQKKYSKHISAFCVLGTGVVQYGSISNIVEIDVNPSSTGVSEVFMKESNDGDSIVRFTWLINSTLNQIVLGKPNLTEYLDNSTERFNKRICVTPELMSNGMKMIFDGKTILVTDLSRLMMKFGKTKLLNSISLLEFLTDNDLTTRIILTSYFNSKVAQYTSEGMVQCGLDSLQVESLVTDNYERIDQEGFVFSDNDLLQIRMSYYNSRNGDCLTLEDVEKYIEMLRNNKEMLLSVASQMNTLNKNSGGTQEIQA